MRHALVQRHKCPSCAQCLGLCTCISKAQLATLPLADAPASPQGDGAGGSNIGLLGYTGCAPMAFYVVLPCPSTQPARLQHASQWLRTVWDGFAFASRLTLSVARTHHRQHPSGLWHVGVSLLEGEACGGSLKGWTAQFVW